MHFLNNVSKIHFIGIGGISMSGLAEIVLDRGYKVEGSDIQNSPIIERIRSKGAIVNIPHNGENLKDADLVVYTSAVKKDNPEMIKAQELNIPIVDRASFLGDIMKEYKFGIAIAGCHGKTTTTSMISLILKNARLDPTVLLGGELDAIGGNVRIGRSPYFITEACEYMENFLKFHPFVGVILNIGIDHLDYFKDLDHIKSAFLKFARLVPKDGCLFLCSDDTNTRELTSLVDCNKIIFGLENNSDYTANIISYDEEGRPSFEVFKNNTSKGVFTLKIHGKHNVLNSLAAFAVADYAGVPLDIIRKSLSEFSGTHRRFETKGVYNDITVIDDYAHHPTEIKVTLDAAKKIKHNKLWCIFQPHTYTRTNLLFNEFADSFNDADEIIIADIYAAREKDTGLVSSKELAEEINKKIVNKKAAYMDSFESIAEHVAKNAMPRDLVMTIGAGSITDLGPMILTKLKSNS